MKIRRSVFAYIVPVVWLAPIGYHVSNIGDDTFRILFAFMSLPWLINLVGLFLRPNAFVIERDTLTYFSRWFRIKRIPITDIIRIDLQASPFGFSGIHLRDGSKLEFNYYLISEPQLVHAMRELNIPMT